MSKRGQRLSFGSDICADDGQLLAKGPSAAIALFDDHSAAVIAINQWMSSFERFLLENYSMIAAAAFELT